jgi:hypothetical protein
MSLTSGPGKVDGHQRLITVSAPIAAVNGRAIIWPAFVA